MQHDSPPGLPAAPAVRRRRSTPLGCVGLVIAVPAALFVLLAIVDLATGAENSAGALGAGCCCLVVAALGAAAVAFGFSTVPGSLTFDDAKRARAAFEAVVDTSAPVAQRLNAAAGLLLDKRFEESFRAYQEIAEQHPEHQDTAYSQMGANCYFLGRYEEAIHW